MTKRSPAEYDFPALEFDEHLLTKHFTPLGSRKIEFVVVHHMTIVDTSDQGALDACYWVWLERQASAHYGAAGELVTQYVWDKDYAWACGDTYGNLHGIHIEHRNSSAGPKWLVAALTMKTGAKLAAYIHVAKNLGRPVDRKTLRQHDEFYATACPGPFLGGTEWGAYVREAQKVYDQITGAVPVPEVPPTNDGSYVMKAGDTLWSVSQQFGVTVAELSKWNEITDHMSLPIGARLDVTAPPEPEPSPHVAVWGKPETFVLGATGPDVTHLGERIVIWSKALDLPDPYDVGPGPKHGPRDVSGLSAIQVAWGYGDSPADLALGGNSDGYPGPVTFTDLAADPPTPSGTEVTSAIQNMAGNNATGIRTAKARMARYIAARKNTPVNIINTQETTVASTVRPRLDAGLKPLGYARTGGGKGRYCYTRGVHVIAYGLFTVPSKWWFKSDDKQAAWVVYELDGALGMDVSMHLESDLGSTADALRVKQALNIAEQALEKAKYRRVPAQNVMLTGDTNSEGMVIDALTASGWRNVAAGTPYEHVTTFMGWHGRSRRRFDYAIVRADAGPASIEAISHNTTISDHAGLRVRRTLTK